MIETIMDSLIKLGPVVSILVAIIYYFKSKFEKKEEMCAEEIDKLHLEIRNGEKEHLKSNYKMLTYIESLSLKDDLRNKDVLSEIKSCREDLTNRISNLK